MWRSCEGAWELRHATFHHVGLDFETRRSGKIASGQQGRGNIGTPIECSHTLQYYIHCYHRLPISPRVMMVHDVKTTLIVDVSSLPKQTRTRKF